MVNRIPEVKLSLPLRAQRTHMQPTAVMTIISRFGILACSNQLSKTLKQLKVPQARDMQSVEIQYAVISHDAND